MWAEGKLLGKEYVQDIAEKYRNKIKGLGILWDLEFRVRAKVRGEGESMDTDVTKYVCMWGCGDN